MKKLMFWLILAATISSANCADLVDELIGAAEKSIPVVPAKELSFSVELLDFRTQERVLFLPSAPTVKSMAEMLDSLYRKFAADLDKLSSGSISALRSLGFTVDVNMGSKGVLGSTITIASASSISALDAVSSKSLMATLVKNLNVKVTSIKSSSVSASVSLPTSEFVTLDDVLNEFLSGSKIKEFTLSPV